MIWQVPMVVTTLVAWLSAPSSSLSEVAQKEAVRRLITAPSTAAVSNDTLPRPLPGDVAAAPVNPPTDMAASAPPAIEGPAPAPPPVEVQAEITEQAWRDRAAALRTASALNQRAVDEVQARVALLQRDVISRDDPAQRALLQGELAQALNQLEKAKAKVEADVVALAKLKEEARRQRVPPGWIR